MARRCGSHGLRTPQIQLCKRAHHSNIPRLVGLQRHLQGRMRRSFSGCSTWHERQRQTGSQHATCLGCLNGRRHSRRFLLFKRAVPVPATESAQGGRRGEPQLGFDASIRAFPLEHRLRLPRARPAGAAKWFVVAYCVHRADFLPSSACLVAMLPYVRGDFRGVQTCALCVFFNLWRDAGAHILPIASAHPAHPAHRERTSCPSCPSRAHILPILPIASAHPAHREHILPSAE